MRRACTYTPGGDPEEFMRERRVPREENVRPRLRPANVWKAMWDATEYDPESDDEPEEGAARGVGGAGALAGGGEAVKSPNPCPHCHWCGDHNKWILKYNGRNDLVAEQYIGDADECPICHAMLPNIGAMSVQERFGLSLRDERRRKWKLTKAALARDAKCSAGALSDYESGKRVPTLAVALRIAKALMTTVDYMVR